MSSLPKMKSVFCSCLSALTYKSYTRTKLQQENFSVELILYFPHPLHRREHCCMKIGKSCRTLFIWHQVNARLQRLNREIMIADISDKTVSVRHKVMVGTRIFPRHTSSTRYDDPETFFAHFSLLCQI